MAKVPEDVTNLVMEVFMEENSIEQGFSTFAEKCVMRDRENRQKESDALKSRVEDLDKKEA